MQLLRVGVVTHTDHVQLNAALASPLSLGQGQVRVHSGVAVRDDDGFVWDAVTVAAGCSEHGRVEKFEGRLGVGLTTSFDERKGQRVLYLDTTNVHTTGYTN